MPEIRPFSPGDKLFLALTAPPPSSPEAEEKAGEAIGSIRAGLRPGGPLPFPADGIGIKPEELIQARNRAPERFLSAVSLARVNLRTFHEYQRRRGYAHDDGDGVFLARKAIPLASVGICCGSSFADLLMCAVPAQVAGVGRIVAVAEPGGDGRIDPLLLATAKILSVEEVYRLEEPLGAAALALGAGPVPKVDKVAGRLGAAERAVARLLAGEAGFLAFRREDSLALVADDSANARIIAADFLSRSGGARRLGTTVLFTDDRLLAEAVRIEISRGMEQASNPAETAKNLEAASGLFLCANRSEAVRAANLLAPDRLELLTRDNRECLAEVENAGAVFFGPWCPESMGIAFSGVNSLPPAGSPVHASTPGVEDFMKEITVAEYGPERLLKVGRHLLALAEALGVAGLAARERLKLLTGE
ncbi:MAG: histidinol dehydrogenase [Planctomycetota bacterium]|jgi:histidinol dehydrogenase|nr:histidinol dehydrogenase [Planctomycetota bacterium]